MSKYPNELDTDQELPPVNDNITEEGAEAINALRDAVFNLESEVGIGGSGTMNSIAERLGVAIDLNGQIKASAITSLGLVSLPIYDNHIASAANISESKLNLDHSTQNLFDYISGIDSNVYTAMSFIADTGSKVEPHLDGYIYRHQMNHIDVGSPLSYFKNQNNLLRNNSNFYNLFKDLNYDYISHQKADGTNFNGLDPSLPSVGTVPPKNYAHNARGIFINSSNFSYVPQTVINLQDLAEFFDSSSITFLGTRIQTLYSNGIPRASRSGANTNKNFGQQVIPVTKIKTYLLNNLSTTPVDNIDTGDDIIEFLPESNVSSTGLFDSQFSKIRSGDILNITYSDGYGNGPDGYNSPFTIQTVIKSKKPLSLTSDKRYVVRINTKNLYSGNFTAEVFRPSFNVNKFGVLSTSIANAPSGIPSSLIIGNPRSAQTLGIGFEADQLNKNHYNLYLALYPDGNPNSNVFHLPAIDVTGNKGNTPGFYTLDKVVEATNNSFRKIGYNYRFMAFAHKGAFGIMLTDPYNNASFSIINGSLASDGTYDQSSSQSLFPYNVIGLPGFDESDALGFSISGSGSASPNYSFNSSGSVPSAVAQVPTKIFSPLVRNNYYVNGSELDKLLIESNQNVDSFGDTYWDAKIVGKTVIPGTRIETTYQIESDLSSTSLKSGKTLVVLSNNIVDSGRFFIKEVQFDNCNCDGYNGLTNITVFDSVHGIGNSPYANAQIGTEVKIYFSSDSVSFNAGNASDLQVPATQFKRNFEVYVDEKGKTFTHERARMAYADGIISVNQGTITGNSDLSNFNIVSVSPKLKGYTSNNVTKINLVVDNYNFNTGQYSAYLRAFNGTTETNRGRYSFGKKGHVLRLYDQSNIDYIDVILDYESTLLGFSASKNIDIQLFNSLQLDEEMMPLASVQYNDTNNKISYLQDLRQFGNTSEKQLTTSALDFISYSNAQLNENGLIRGFGVSADTVTTNKIIVDGGVALVNGKFIQMNPEYVDVPILFETLVPYGGASLSNNIEWILCLNDKSEYEYVAFSDFISGNTTYTSFGLNAQRIFYVTNPNDSNSTPYAVRSAHWRDLISAEVNRNIVPIAIITPTLVYNNPVWQVNSFTIKRAQRYLSRGYTGLNNGFDLGKSFYNNEELNEWLNRLNSYSTAVNSGQNRLVREIFVSESMPLSSTPLSPNENIKVVYRSGGGKISLDNTIINSNIEFDGLTIDIDTNTIGARIQGNNITFKNCIFNYRAFTSGDYTTGNLNNPLKGAIYCAMDGYNIKNFRVENCTFNITNSDHHPIISFVSNLGTGTINDCYIKENKINSTFVGDDKRAVISFVSTKLTTPNASGGKLVNVQVSNNTCNKNQMIIMSAIKNGSNLITDALEPINVNIENNICGTICYLMKQNNILSLSESIISDKFNILNINNNNCKYIYTGFHTGSEVIAPSTVSSSTNPFTNAQNLYSNSTYITKNTCSWIHCKIKVPSSNIIQEPILLIDANNQSPSDITFLTPYINNWGNIAIGTSEDGGS